MTDHRKVASDLLDELYSSEVRWIWERSGSIDADTRDLHAEFTARAERYDLDFDRTPPEEDD